MKKLTKLISVFALASAVCVGVGITSGCKGDDGGSAGTPHTHTYSTQWSYDENQHWHAATCEHTDLKNDVGNHVDEDVDGFCDVCGYEVGIPVHNVGIEMTKTTTEYVLDGSLTANIALDDISVNIVRSDGTDGAVITDYEIKCYKGQVELTEAKMAEAEPGAYNIWASAQVEGLDEKAESFVIVYVVDAIESITFNSEAAGTVVTQQAGAVDKMSSTWNFTATYSSGRQENLTADDVTITGVVPGTVTDNGVANVSFVYTNAKGEESEPVTTQVNYTVTEAGGQQTVENHYSFDALAAVVSDPAAGSLTLTQDDFTGVNSFITVVAGGTVNYRGPSNNVLEIKNEALSVTFQGTGTLVIQARSTSNSNTSSIAIKGPDGNYVEGTYTSANVQKDDALNVYTVTGAMNEISFIISQPGTYTLCTLSSVTVNGSPVGTGRNTRIGAIDMTDVFGGEGEGGDDTAPTVENVNINFGTLEAYSGLSTTNKTSTLAPNTEIVAGSGVSVIGTADYTVEYSAKQVSGSTEKPTVRLKLGGAADFVAGTNALKIVTSDAATVKLYIRSSSDSAARQIAMFGEDYAQIGEAVNMNEALDGLVYEVTFTVDAAGTYYFGSLSGGIGIYNIVVDYGA